MNIKQEHAEFENWARWYALPVTRLVNDDRYESLETEAAYKAWQAGRAAQEDSEDKWRDLALQFDGHRMQALAWLKQILAESPADAWPFARTFLKSPPMSGEAVLAERIEELAALQSQDREDASCTWHNDPETDNSWSTGCRQLFEIYDGTPTENGMEFCCYCGKPIREAIDHARRIEGDNDAAI